MTTPKPKIQPAAQHWEPYPDLPPETRDMEQMPAAHYLREMLRYILTPGDHYPHHPTILIGDQIPIYYGPARPGGGPPAHVIPDCLVALDVDAAAIWQRVGYDPIQNGKPPDVVIEVASRSTFRNDNVRKREIYRQIGVPEYWRFDPTGGDFSGRPIIGERLVEGRYEQLPLIEYDAGEVGSTSPALNLNFRWREWRFRIHDPATGEEMQHWQETAARLEETNNRLAERAARLQSGNDRLQEEVDRLRAENRRLRGGG